MADSVRPHLGGERKRNRNLLLYGVVLILAQDACRSDESRGTVGRHDLEKRMHPEGKIELVRPLGLGWRLEGTALWSGVDSLSVVGGETHFPW